MIVQKFRSAMAAIACAAIGFMNPTIVNAGESTSTDMVVSDINEIVQIRPVDSDVGFGSYMEIELSSSRLFPARAMPPMLRIGDQRIRKSRSPNDGSLNTLIFVLTAEEYANTESGDPVSVVIGQGDSPTEQWDFGYLNK